MTGSEILGCELTDDLQRGEEARGRMRGHLTLVLSCIPHLHVAEVKLPVLWKMGDH